MASDGGKKMTNADRIIAVLKERSGLDDDEIATRIGISRHTVNQECRLLVSAGILIRDPGGPKGKIINTLTEGGHTRVNGPAASENTPLPSHRRSLPRADTSCIAVSEETGETLQIGETTFTLVCEISPARTSEGILLVVYPQNRYQNAAGLRLNRYGAGPFCKFKIPNKYTVAGVYILSVNGEPKYVGECENLASRYNTGYGNISPRNCFEGGQETNCRINNLIYDSLFRQNVVKLWFLATPDYKSLETKLRAALRLPWNRA